MLSRKFFIVAVLIGTLFGTVAKANEIEWEVYNPFRFYKKHEHFQRHYDAYLAVLKENGGKIPDDIVLRIERKLNAPGCTDSSSPEKCYTSRTSDYADKKLGWAAKSFSPGETCYGEDKLIYKIDCMRYFGANHRSDDLIEPEKHYVSIFVKGDAAQRFSGQTCEWTVGGKTTRQDCKSPLAMQEISYPDGTAVTVTLPDRSKIEKHIKVIDTLIVGFGDSFASGEGNPDKPVTLHSQWSLPYEWPGTQNTNNDYWPMRATIERPPVSYRPRARSEYIRAKVETPDDGARLTQDEIVDLDRFTKARAFWVSPDCHRSQYSYQFRVALQLAMEDRKRAVTFIHLACTGAEITAGLFGTKPARDERKEKVAPQLNQLADILCKPGTKRPANYKLPLVYRDGHTDVRYQFFPPLNLCESKDLRRKIDLTLFSFGGNDIGFSALVGYSIMTGARDITTTAHYYELFTGQQLVYGVNAPSIYLEHLDERFAQAKIALNRHFGVAPDRVIQTAYESFQQNESKTLCKGSVGMDLHPRFRIIDRNLKQANDFSKTFFKRLKCIAKADGTCPQNLATKTGTGFHFVDKHQETFTDRGICALSKDELPYGPGPRYSRGSFDPWIPAHYNPYGPTHRYFRSPNDAFMTANMHLDKSVSGFLDMLNITWAALYSGAFHRNAQGHAVVADYVMPTAREVLGYK